MSLVTILLIILIILAFGGGGFLGGGAYRGPGFGLGGILLIFSDITDELQLRSRYNAQIQVQTATLDKLNDAVAVFGSDGRLRLHNDAFEIFWGVSAEKLAEAGSHDDPEMPQPRSPHVLDSGMGDLLRFDAERLRILVERHFAHTGSARAKELLDNWSEALNRFVKVMPTDYARALTEMKAARAKVAAE